MNSRAAGQAETAARSRRALRQGPRIDRRGGRVPRGPPHHDDDVAQQRQQPRQDARQEQPADRGLGEDAVEDEQHRGRDQRAERAPRRDRGRRQLRIIAEAQHLGHADAAHRRGTGDGRARDGGKAAAADQRGHADPARHAAQPDIGRVIDPRRDAGVIGDVAQGHEERDHRQIVRVDQLEEAVHDHGRGRVDRALRHEAAGAERVDHEGADRRHGRQHEGDGNAQRQKHDDHADGDQPDGGCIHQTASSSTCAGSSSEPVRRRRAMSSSATSTRRMPIRISPSRKTSFMGQRGMPSSPS